jgi:tetratricopeptide (TPR) repeat protein
LGRSSAVNSGLHLAQSLTEAAGKPEADRIEPHGVPPWDWPESRPGSPVSQNEAGSRSKETALTGPWEFGGREAPSHQDSHQHNGASDIFSIARAAGPETLPAKPSAFEVTLSSRPKKADSDLFFTAVLPTDENGVESQPHSGENAEAIEYFEAGLVFLQRNELKNALSQFESALRLDPQNRLCRANIQRIREKLSRDE